MPPLPAVGSRWGENGSECTTPGGHASGGHNELWEFGDATTPMLIKMVELRESLKEYVMELVRARTSLSLALLYVFCGVSPLRHLNLIFVVL
jgi:alpha-glucosidase (family GH31 glycosyl hydrolase)